MNELEQKVLEIIEKIEGVSPQATELILKTVQVEGAANVILGLIVIAGIILIFKFAPIKNLYDCVSDRDDFVSAFSFCTLLILGLCVFVFGLNAIFDVFYPWNYIAIFSPELALAHRLIGE